MVDFPEPVGSRNQNNTVRVMDKFAEDTPLVGIKAQLLDSSEVVRFSQYAHNDFLAINNGQNAYAEVKLLVIARNVGKASVLWAAAFGDIHVPHNFDAPNHRSKQWLR